MTEPKTLLFAHEALTKIDGRPTAFGLRQLKRELYANAMAIPTDLGGGAHGYLGAIMTAADYANVPNTVAFVTPVHPGTHPGHAVNATSAAITETNRAYLAAKEAAVQYTTVTQALKQQLLNAVNVTFLQALADDILGFATVSCAAMLAHLDTTYGTITPDDLEANKLEFAAEWNPDSPIEDLFKRSRMCRQFAAAGNDDISESAAVRNLLAIIEKTGVLSDGIRDWRKRPTAEWTLAHFTADFSKANKERTRLLTAGTAGYHGANAATDVTLPRAPPATPPAALASAHVITNDGMKMYYCWSHGLTKNADHTSATCQNKKEGHDCTATAGNMKGGNNRIRGPPRRPTNSE